jgi:autophagy-related protein 9
VVNLLLAPFLLVFLLIYFFLRHAEKFYHSPSSLGARRWSPLASWKLREFNELPYYVRHRSPPLPCTPITATDSLLQLSLFLAS